jgi:hypothetical protein
MIYQSYNFVDSYSNASGNRKNSMVLGELGKVINKEPKAVISALQDAGVKVPRNPSKRDLVRLIIANKRNKNLVQNLAVLITASATTKDSFQNLMEEKIPILSASEGLAGGKVTSTTAPKELAGTKDKNKGGFLKSIGDFFQKRKEQKALDPTKKSTPQEESAWKRFGNWFSKNRETIGQVGNTLYGSLGTANQNQIPTDGSGGSGDSGGAGADQTWIQKNKVLVVVGLIAVAGGIYFLTKGSGGKGKGK